MLTKWRINDLIDLEYFLHIDMDGEDRSGAQAPEARDRNIFLEYIQPRIREIKTPSRRLIIRFWLERRREMEKDTSVAGGWLPGDVFAETYRLLGYGLFILGGLAGIGIALSLLTYTGSAPLNVSVYLGVAVFSQILLLVLLGGLFLIRLIRPRLFYASIIYSVLSRLILTMAGKATRRMMATLPGHRRESLSALAGLVRGKKRIYGSLFYWPVFIVAQLFGIGFNTGLLGATLLKVLGTDMAFGWQSTLQVSEKMVHGIVRLLATPWSGLVPAELAYPTLAQIEGSRLILKDGIYHLATPDLVAWWPFLCFAVLFYGLLPRIILVFSGWLAQAYLLNKIDFNHGACDRLIDRMTTPRVRIDARFEGGDKASEATGPVGGTVADSDESPGKAGGINTAGNFIVFVPDDIFEACTENDLERVVKGTLGGRVVEMIRVDPVDPDKAVDPNRLILADSGNGRRDILVLQEAWQPPIIEDVAFYKALRYHLGDRWPIMVGLIGKPTPETIFTPVTPTHWRTWKEKITSLGDPYLRLERLVHGRF